MSAFSFTEFFDHTLSIISRTETIGAGGGIVSTTTVRIADIPCAIADGVGNKELQAAMDQIEATHVAYIQSVPTLYDSDLAVDEDGVTYEIVDWQDYSVSAIGTMFGIYLREQLASNPGES